ncbi:hypothetical protein, partial [Shewanella algae]|uniref:hypothetical protein n=1 Tax=Shewanella algae TaxID=38313 RepID=UPI00313E32BC
DKFLRNWLRQWLNKLEKKQPGGLRNLSLGLDQLVMKALERPSQIETVLTDGAINRRLFLQLDRDQRRQIAAHYFRHRGLKNYTQGHVEELLERLDDRRREYTFEMLKCCW